MERPFPILEPEEAARFITHLQTVGFSPAGPAKVIPRALAACAEQEYGVGNPFQIGVLTGAGIGIGDLVVAALMEEGSSESEARAGAGFSIRRASLSKATPISRDTKSRLPISLAQIVAAFN
jgi:acyl-CoA hydrolase